MLLFSGWKFREKRRSYQNILNDICIHLSFHTSLTILGEEKMFNKRGLKVIYRKVSGVQEKAWIYLPCYYKLFIENINLIFLFILVKIGCLVIATLLIRSINKVWPAISYATSEISSRDEFWRECRIRQNKWRWYCSKDVRKTRCTNSFLSTAFTA